MNTPMNTAMNTSKNCTLLRFKHFWPTAAGTLLVALLVTSPSGTAHADTSHGEFVAARQKWQAAGLHDYAFTFYQSCFCPVRHQLRITVQDDKVLSAVNVGGGAAVKPEEMGKPLTMAEIFQQIEEGYAKHADHIRLSLNLQYGYPEEVFIDYVEMMADEELRYSISDFAH
jgi:hypothetical protein